MSTLKLNARAVASNLITKYGKHAYMVVGKYIQNASVGGTVTAFNFWQRVYELLREYEPVERRNI